jgi:hypothetical protein
MIGIATWLLGSTLGRQVLLWGSAVLLVLVVIARIYSAGRAAEKARQSEAALKNLRERVKVDDQITKLGPDERRKRLERWMQPDG